MKTWQITSPAEMPEYPANAPPHPFRINLGSLLPQSIGYKREFPLEYSKIQLDDDLTLTEFIGLVTANRTPQGILIQGDFEGKLALDCVRCLKLFDYTLQWEITELYVFNRRNATEDDLILPDNAGIDLGELIQEEAHLDRPFNPVCKEGCLGLCQICGTDLNLDDCGHEDIPPEEPPEDENSPFAGLKDLI